ncbi:disease resistance-like protein DSC1 [Ziziphus jujuba]|uniref:ADP-ribosyl cyclase/cyclic ADP-ribose hydrolase n=1 Tax=Ziziphus jujuba TaxID=326968 RepID=A0A6P6GKF8_ZIZJJ|nr:disease resistance-like protein DSC1 [Ziziphus jujuba]
MASFSSSAAAAADIPPQEKHEVFLSFRGEDTRTGFTSYLYEALCRKQIISYMDDHQLERGDEISPTLLKAIEESKISVIIFSENYASSTWCLEELAKILECKKRNGQIVIPIFYGTEPSVVRKQEKSYAYAFAQLEERFKDSMEKVQQWRHALTEVAGLTGLDSKQFRLETQLVQQIVEDISLKLPKLLSLNDRFEGRNLIGIEKRIKEIESLLCLGSKDVRIIGIWGMGGIGKTTLASIIYQRLSYSHFEARCFLEDVREESFRNGTNHLRKELLASLLDKDEAMLRMDTPSAISPFMRKRFRRRKVLVVLDDLDSSIFQFKTLVEGYDDFAPGSRIIFTTRDVRVLKTVADEIYKVEELDYYESLDLFCLHAFKKSSLAADYTMLSDRAISYANGNPLAIQALGSSLHSRSKQEWENTLDRLKMYPNPNIQRVLRISYEGLDDEGIQKIFLDIACFFQSHYFEDELESKLDSSGHSFVKLGISDLINKSLINESNIKCLGPLGIPMPRLKMHDLLQQTGRSIVRGESKEPGNCSRLWTAKEICHVLERNTGSATIEGISFNVSEIRKVVKVSPAAFSKMYNLRYLKIYAIHENNKCRLCLPQGLDSYLSDTISYFEWESYPLKTLPSDFIPENLVELRLPNNQLEVLWDESQPLEKLKVIDLSHSKLLTQIPNLSQASNLEIINLEGCTSLIQVPSYFKNLHNLQCLRLTDCSNLINVEGLSGHENFEAIYCNNIDKLKSSETPNANFPMNLRTLFLGGTAIEAVPSSFGCLLGLVQLDLDNCKRLKSIPTSICKLKSLESLNLFKCPNLENFPEILEPMECLKCLRLEGTGIKELPESIVNLIGLDRLFLEGCSKLQKLPTLPLGLSYLDVENCESLKSLAHLPSSLEHLLASHCTLLETISSWRTPLGYEISDSYSMDGSIRFDNCLNLDQNTRNNIIPDPALFRILSSATSYKKRPIDHQGLEFPLFICYPGDEIPKRFSYQSLGSSMNIQLPPNWCNTNFLGFAVCFIIDQYSHITDGIEYKLSFKTINENSLYDFHDSDWLYRLEKINSDHVWIVHEASLSCKGFEEKFGANWPSICSNIVTGISFHVRPFRRDDRFHDSCVEEGVEHCKIKKCGIWMIYEEDADQVLDGAEEEPEVETTKRRFGESSEGSGISITDVVGSDDENEYQHKRRVISSGFEI